VDRRLHGVKFAATHPRRIMVKHARQRARAASVPFDIHEGDFEIPSVCPVLGIALCHGRGRRGPTDSSPTLDRIVPALGYVRGNVIVVSWRANRLKSDATIDELARILDFYRAHHASAVTARPPFALAAS
jgi:hypothetical protein